MSSQPSYNKILYKMYEAKRALVIMSIASANLGLLVIQLLIFII